MSQDDSRQPAAERQVKAMLAALAFGSLLAGAAIYLLRETLGIPDDTARMVALVFVAGRGGRRPDDLLLGPHLQTVVVRISERSVGLGDAFLDRLQPGLLLPAESVAASKRSQNIARLGKPAAGIGVRQRCHLVLQRLCKIGLQLQVVVARG